MPGPPESGTARRKRYMIGVLSSWLSAFAQRETMFGISPPMSTPSAKERAQIAKQIQELSGKRDAYIKEEVQKKGLDTNKAFDEAVRKSITEQGAKKGFEFEKK